MQVKRVPVWEDGRREIEIMKEAKRMDMLKANYEQHHMSAEQLEKMKERIAQAKWDKRKAVRSQLARRGLSAAAVIAAVFIALPNTSQNAAYAMSKIPVLGDLVDVVTFRDYQTDNGIQSADVKEPQLAVQSDDGTLADTADAINEQIDAVTTDFIAKFEESKKKEEGYQNLVVTSEVMATTEDYFTLKLICYQSAGSGEEEDYYYTIDRTTNQQLALSDLFKEGADYVTPISENIKEQMRSQMAADENVSYWLDDEDDFAEYDFNTIDENTSFYLDEDGRVVIAFNEGDVGPMSMGCVTFTIDNDVLASIRVR
jgi:hypothetical protein